MPSFAIRTKSRPSGPLGADFWGRLGQTPNATNLNGAASGGWGPGPGINSGTIPPAVLTALMGLLPPGLDGEDGEPGPPGVPGAQGPQGIPGVAGVPGFVVHGWDGEDGDFGPPGPVGLTGATGAQGPPGAGGQSLIGPPGQDGEPGEDGWPIPGAQGAAGAAGAAGATGAAGLFLPGLEGEPGEDGWSIPGPHLAALGAHTTAIGTGQADSLTSGGPGTVNQVWTSNGASADPTFQTVPIQPPGGRLTLTTGTPVMTADATAQTTVFYDSYVHAYVPVYNGTAWTYLVIGSDEISMGLDAVTPHFASGNPYDVFAINNSGTLVIAIGPAWSSTTSRGTGAGTTQLSRQNGIFVNTNALTHAWGGASGTTDFGSVAAKSATYLGTIYATANGQTGVQFQPAAAAGGSNAIVGLWNAYNRVRIQSRSQDSTNSYAYNTATWRAADGSNSNRVTYIDGLGQTAVAGTYYSVGFTSVAGGRPELGMNRDSTTAAPFTVGCESGTGSTIIQLIARDNWSPSLGLHFIQAMEIGALSGGGSGTMTWNAITNGMNLVVELDN